MNIKRHDPETEASARAARRDFERAELERKLLKAQIANENARAAHNAALANEAYHRQVMTEQEMAIRQQEANRRDEESEAWTDYLESRRQPRVLNPSRRD